MTMSLITVLRPDLKGRFRTRRGSTTCGFPGPTAHVLCPRTGNGLVFSSTPDAVPGLGSTRYPTPTQGRPKV